MLKTNWPGSWLCMFLLGFTSAAICWSVQRRSLQSFFTSHNFNVFCYRDKLHELSFQGYMSGLKCTIDHHQISSRSDVKVLFSLWWVMYPTFLFSSSFRSQLLRSCCGRRHLEPIGGCWRRYRGHGRAERCRVDPASARSCGGEGSWHRDLMHKEKQKSHCQGFPLFHSSAGDRLILSKSK